MSSAVNASQYAFSFREPRPVSLLHLWQGRFYSKEGYFFEELPPEESTHYPKFEDTQKCLKIIEVVKRELQLDARLWATDLSPWNNLVEAIRQCWGDVWVCFCLANIASGNILRQHQHPIHAIFIAIGGGLISVSAAYVKRLRPEIKLIGVEPVDADAMYQSLKAGHRSRLFQLDLFADGVAVREIGAETFRSSHFAPDRTL